MWRVNYRANRIAHFRGRIAKRSELNMCRFSHQLVNLNTIFKSRIYFWKIFSSWRAARVWKKNKISQLYSTARSRVVRSFFFLINFIFISSNFRCVLFSNWKFRLLSLYLTFIWKDLQSVHYNRISHGWDLSDCLETPYRYDICSPLDYRTRER